MSDAENTPWLRQRAVEMLTAAQKVFLDAPDGAQVDRNLIDKALQLLEETPQDVDAITSISQMLRVASDQTSGLPKTQASMAFGQAASAFENHIHSDPALANSLERNRDLTSARQDYFLQRVHADVLRIPTPVADANLDERLKGLRATLRTEFDLLSPNKLVESVYSLEMFERENRGEINFTTGVLLADLNQSLRGLIDADPHLRDRYLALRERDPFIYLGVVPNQFPHAAQFTETGEVIDVDDVRGEGIVDDTRARELHASALMMLSPIGGEDAQINNILQQTGIASASKGILEALGQGPREVNGHLLVVRSELLMSALTADNERRANEVGSDLPPLDENDRRLVRDALTSLNTYIGLDPELAEYRRVARDELTPPLDPQELTETVREAHAMAAITDDARDVAIEAIEGGGEGGRRSWANIVIAAGRIARGITIAVVGGSGVSIWLVNYEAKIIALAIKYTSPENVAWLQNVINLLKTLPIPGGPS